MGHLLPPVRKDSQMIDDAMNQYNFRITATDPVINGAKVSTKANSEEEARENCVRCIKRANRDLGVQWLEFLGTGNLTPAQMMDATGGKILK